MRLLIFTQKIYKNDTTLGFFCGWVKEMAKIAKEIHIICLEEGKHDMPENVTVYSLGKEQGCNKLEYVIHFYHHLYVVNGQYDKVFVHMNEEYALLGGLYWKIIGVPMYMWRNHPDGSILTRIAVAFSKKVFCTSKESFTARFKKTVIMPAGVDTDIFKQSSEIVRKKHSVCMVGRISPVKRLDLALSAVKFLVDSGTQISLSIIGSALPKDRIYLSSLREFVLKNELSSYVQFLDPVPQEKLPEIYSAYEICLNLTKSGSFDKTIVEAISCGAMPIVSNTSLRNMLPDICIVESDPKKIAESIEKMLNAPVRIETKVKLEEFAKSQSLISLMKKMKEEIK